MHVLSCNVGRIRTVPMGTRQVRTAIFKEPVSGLQPVGAEGLENDRQADKRYHGGLLKAVYGYPHEHYAWWSEHLGMELTPGAFGENLTTVGLLETSLRRGDRLRVGTTVLEVTEPRTPCFKLNLRFGRDDMVKRFFQAGRCGFYFRVVTPGTVETGSAVELLGGGQGDSLAEVFAKKRS